MEERKEGRRLAVFALVLQRTQRLRSNTMSGERWYWSRSRERIKAWLRGWEDGNPLFLSPPPLSILSRREMRELILGGLTFVLSPPSLSIPPSSLSLFLSPFYPLCFLIVLFLPSLFSFLSHHPHFSPPPPHIFSLSLILRESSLPLLLLLLLLPFAGFVGLWCRANLTWKTSRVSSSVVCWLISFFLALYFLHLVVAQRCFEDVYIHGEFWRVGV